MDLAEYIRASIIVGWFATDEYSNSEGLEKLNGLSWLKQLRVSKAWNLSNVSSRIEDLPTAQNLFSVSDDCCALTLFSFSTQTYTSYADSLLATMMGGSNHCNVLWEIPAL